MFLYGLIVVTYGASLMASDLPSPEQAFEALAFAHGAILDAIGLDDGLDARAGEKVLHMIRAALTANGRTPPDWPTDDEPVASLPIWSVSTLPDLKAALHGLQADMQQALNEFEAYRVDRRRQSYRPHQAVSRAEQYVKVAVSQLGTILGEP